VSGARLAGWIGAVVLLGLAVLGGEYSALDWLKLRRDLAAERETLAQLRQEIDSLATLAHDLENSPAAQERAARQEFGMIREGEILYRLVPPR
jgi:cell division protein FtsB